MTATAKQSGGFGNADGTDSFECRKGYLKVFKFIN